METRKFTPVLRKLAVLVAGGMLIVGLLLFAQGMIDTKDYREQLVTLIKEKTGKTVAIKGKVSATLLPRPSLYVPGIELRSDDPKDLAPTFTAKAMYIHADVFSLFSDRLKVSSISLQEPVLEIRRAEDGVIHWDWLSDSLLKSGLGNDATPLTFDIIDGDILYHNDVDNTDLPIRSVNAALKVGGSASLAGSLQILERGLGFDVRIGGDATGGSVPLNAKLISDMKDEMTLAGTIDLSAPDMKIDGDYRVNVVDAMAWVTGQRAIEKDGVNQAKPLSIGGTWSQTGWAAKVSDATFDGMGSKAGGTMALSWPDVPTIEADLAFAELRYSDWETLVLAVVERLQRTNHTRYQENEEEIKNKLPSDIKITLNTKAEKFYMREQVWQNASISATLQDDAITVHQFAIDLPDAAQVTLFGIVSQSSTKNLRFEGSVEAEGKSLRKFLTIFDASAVDLPETGFGDFYIRSNIFISPEQVRLSEADFRFSALKLGGGMVAYLGEEPRIEADVKLSNINFDYFRDAWRESEKAHTGKDSFLRFSKGLNFGWLKNLRTKVDFMVMVDQFTFLERAGQAARFRLKAQQNEFVLTDMRFEYPSDTVEASFNLNVSSDLPFITLLFNTSSEWNTNYFALPETTEPKKEPATTEEEKEEGTKRWSKALIDMSWMEGYNGAFDISIGKLVHGDYSFNRFRLKTQLRDELLTIQSMNFGYWQGYCEVAGTLYGGKVPGISVSFTLTNVDLKDVVQSFSTRTNVTGKMGISGTIQTSGVNMHSWVSQAESKLGLNGVGVGVDRLNLKAVMDTVSVARTPADVVSNVNLVLPKGSTEFALSGPLNIKNGVVRTPGLKLRAGTIDGTVEGDLKLLPWKMQLSTKFEFPAMTSDTTTPTLTVDVSGGVDDPEMRVDTDSLEAYVSKRIVGK